MRVNWFSMFQRPIIDSHNQNVIDLEGKPAFIVFPVHWFYEPICLAVESTSRSRLLLEKTRAIFKMSKTIHQDSNKRCFKKLKLTIQYSMKRKKNL